MKLKVLLILIILFLQTNVVLAKEKDFIEISSPEELNKAILDCNMDFTPELSVKTSFNPAVDDLFYLFVNAREADEYKGYQLYRVYPSYEKIDDDYYTTFYFSYYTDKREHKKIEKRVALMADDMEGLTDYEKIKFSHDYLVLKGEYYISGQGAYAAMFQGKTACNGYASAFKRLMDEVNIPCQVNVDIDHMWNTVYLDGYWYNMDVTWDDAGGDNIDYSFFLVNNEDWKDHTYGKSDAPTSYQTPDTSERFSYTYYNLIDFSKQALILILTLFFALILKRLLRFRRKKVSYIDIPPEELEEQGFEDNNSY